jgi:hypothetical protein
MADAVFLGMLISEMDAVNTLKRPPPDHTGKAWQIDPMHPDINPRPHYLVDILQGYSRVLFALATESDHAGRYSHSEGGTVYL